MAEFSSDGEVRVESSWRYLAAVFGCEGGLRVGGRLGGVSWSVTRTSRQAGRSVLNEVVFEGRAGEVTEVEEGRMVLRREDRLDRLGKFSRISQELQTADPDFDREIYVDADMAPALLFTVLGKAPVREGVRQTLQLLPVDLEVHPGAVRFKMDGDQVAPGPEVVAAVLRGLNPLVEAAASASGLLRAAPAHQARDAPFSLLAAVGWLGAMVGLLPNCLAPEEVLANRPTLQIALSGGLLGLVVSGLLVPGLRGYANAFRVLLKIALILALVAMVWAPPLASFANRWFDGSPAVQHRTIVVRVQHHRKASPSLDLQEWRPGLQGTVTVPDPGSVPPSIPWPCLVTIRRGVFWPWLQSIQGLPQGRR